MVSYLKSMYGDAATPENDFGYDWHPKIGGDHSHMAMMVNMADGKVRGMFAMGQNPATSINGRFQREALAKLDWLVVKDNFETETAAFWYKAPEVESGEVRPEDIKTEVFLFPSAQVAEMDGHVHQHPAPDPVARQGGRPAGRRALRHSGSPTGSACA